MRFGARPKIRAAKGLGSSPRSGGASPRNLFLPVDSAQLAGRKGGGLTNLQHLGMGYKTWQTWCFVTCKIARLTFLRKIHMTMTHMTMTQV